METPTQKEEIDTLINYGIKEGVIDDSAVDWTEEEKQSYFNMCNAYEPSDEV